MCANSLLGRDTLTESPPVTEQTVRKTARGRLFFSEAEKSESGTVPMRLKGTGAEVSAKGTRVREGGSSSPNFF